MPSKTRPPTDETIEDRPRADRGSLPPPPCQAPKGFGTTQPQSGSAMFRAIASSGKCISRSKSAKRGSFLRIFAPGLTT